MLNSVALTGRIANDLVIRGNDDSQYIFFNLAVTRTYKPKDANQPSADFITCKANGIIAKNLVTYQKKGSLIAVTGSIRTYKRTDQNGVNHQETYVQCDQIDYLEKQNSYNA